MRQLTLTVSQSLKSGIKMGSGDVDAGGNPVIVLQVFSSEHYNILALNVFTKYLLRNIPFLHSF